MNEGNPRQYVLLYAKWCQVFTTTHKENSASEACKQPMCVGVCLLGFCQLSLLAPELKTFTFSSLKLEQESIYCFKDKLCMLGTYLVQYLYPSYPVNDPQKLCSFFLECTRSNLSACLGRSTFFPHYPKRERPDFSIDSFLSIGSLLTSFSFLSFFF